MDDQADRMIRRAGQIALGLADTGLTQAEQMLYRVSPEGRAQARRERRERARARNRMMGELVLAAIAAVLVLAAVGSIAPPLAAGALALAVFLALCLLVAQRASARRVRVETLRVVDLPQLPGKTVNWLSTQRPALPAPAARLTDALSRRLDELQPQLADLPDDAPAAEAVRKLVATELPQLVEGWRAVPQSLRGQPGAGGRTPDAQLMDGLKLIDEEVGRMTEQLARGALDEVATQGRYLELKYRGEGLG